MKIIQFNFKLVYASCQGIVKLFTGSLHEIPEQLTFLKSQFVDFLSL
ncbi:hypothetical protein SAMN05216362_101206 [Piscibacillus halophilus]|uniref:Uncharacterized protein n=1 Tax=Piscibacillus halophilus TaxID=571933 RepID=A0A1H8Z508_9BACI|nr:hypothetical protein SAMN05216362_101206 [Piscibacillus halophilus]